MQAIGFMQEVAEFTFADDKRFPRDWFNPADSAALTPAPRLAESDLRHSLSTGRAMCAFQQLVSIAYGWEDCLPG